MYDTAWTKIWYVVNNEVQVWTQDDDSVTWSRLTFMPEATRMLTPRRVHLEPQAPQARTDDLN